ncbi:AAA family ATPase [Candidatus Latescibacterota bacterium]
MKMDNTANLSHPKQCIDRLEGSIKLNNTDPFVVLYGNVNDLFIGGGLNLDNIDNQIDRMLKNNGYGRVLFYDPLIGLYDVDGLSLETSLPKKDKAVKPFKSGPLGGETVGISSTPERNENFGRKSITDISALETMDSVFKDSELLSAVVFSHADLLGDFNGLGQLRSKLRHWGTEYRFLSRSSFSGKRNIIVFVFQCSNVESVKRVIEDCKLNALENFLFTRDDDRYNFSYIGGPDKEEIKNLINYIGLTRDILFDRTTLSMISEWISMNVLSLRQWFTKLCDLSAINVSGINRLLKEDDAVGFSELSAEERLSDMIGLQSVKKQITDTITVTKRYGIEGAGTLHIAFLGNPGTGKTTVARLVGEMYRNAGVLKRGHTVLANRASLIAPYVGQTAPQVNTMVDRALDGVLFIDEAYSLLGDQFGEEAIATLIERMENERSRLCVILAGYPEETEKLIDVNPGLRSRFQNKLTFDDYSADELLAIFKRIINDMCERNPLMPVLGDGTDERVRNVFLDMTKEKDKVLKDKKNPKYNRFKSWSNGREARNLYEKMRRNCAVRISNSKSTNKQDKLMTEDIPKNDLEYLNPDN